MSKRCCPLSQKPSPIPTATFLPIPAATITTAPTFCSGAAVGDDLLEALVASFVERPHHMSSGSQHCRCILLLSESPRGVGTLCRRLFLYLQRLHTCRRHFYTHRQRQPPPPTPPWQEGAVGHPRTAPRSAAAPAMASSMATGSTRARSCAAPSRSATARRSCGRSATARASCSRRALPHCFSKRIYGALATVLLDLWGEEPVDIENPRPYTKMELTQNFHTGSAQVTHAGCAHMNCKQNFSRDCEMSTHASDLP